MKILINKKGALSMERMGTMKEQYCPYVGPHNNGPVSCGDWCPHFGEPTRIDDKEFKETYKVIPICNGKQINFDECTDERKK